MYPVATMTTAKEETYSRHSLTFPNSNAQKEN